MSKAQHVVDQMIGEVYDEHVKAHDRVQKWDKAHGTYKKLYALKHKAMGLYREMGRAIGYERALARVGLTRADVAHPITGDSIGATHNYKKTRPAKVCKQSYCDAGGQPQTTGDVCFSCREPLTAVQIPISPSYLRKNLARHIVGVETQDGRYVWFDEPVPPQPELELEAESEEKPPITPGDVEQQRRLGKWWK